MKEKNLIILAVVAVICIGLLITTIVVSNQNNTNNTENNTVNITLNNSQNNTTENTTINNTQSTSKSKSKSNNQKSEDSEYGTYINDEYVSMSEKEYAERFPALYHEESLQKGKYDKYHPEFYEIDRENGRI